MWAQQLLHCHLPWFVVFICVTPRLHMFPPSQERFKCGRVPSSLARVHAAPIKTAKLLVPLPGATRLVITARFHALSGAPARMALNVAQSKALPNLLVEVPCPFVAGLFSNDGGVCPFRLPVRLQELPVPAMGGMVGAPSGWAILLHSEPYVLPLDATHIFSILPRDALLAGAARGGAFRDGSGVGVWHQVAGALPPQIFVGLPREFRAGRYGLYRPVSSLDRRRRPRQHQLQRREEKYRHK